MRHPSDQAPVRSRQQGFTLIELFIAVAVAAILLAIATPSFQRVLAKTSASQAANDLVGDLATARTEAATRQQRVCLSAVDDDWLKGWEVKVDSNRDGDCKDATDEVVRVRGALASGFTMSVTRSGSSVAVIPYAPSGSVDGAAADTVATLCKDAGSHPQRTQVKIRASGIASAYRDPTGGSSC